VNQLLNLTPTAIRAFLKDLAEFGQQGDFIRVAVLGVGVSGWQYSLDLDHEECPGDVVMHFDNLKVVVDAESAELLRGTKVEYVKGPDGTGFRFRRPGDW
jgi:iron-sulfur cluster assembly protein